MRSGLHILLPFVILWSLQNGCKTARTAINPEVLTTFAKNIASVLSPSLPSNFQTVNTTSLASNFNISARKTSYKSQVAPNSTRIRRSTTRFPRKPSFYHQISADNKNVATKSTNPYPDVLQRNYRQENNAATFSKDIKAINNPPSNTDRNLDPSRHNVRDNFPSLLYRPRLALAQLSGPHTNALPNYDHIQLTTEQTEFRRTGNRKSSASEQRLSARSPLGGYNLENHNYHGVLHGPTFHQPLYGYNDRQPNGREGNTANPQGTSGDVNSDVETIGGTRIEGVEGDENVEKDENVGGTRGVRGYGFHLYPYYHHPFHGGPGYDFPYFRRHYGELNSTGDQSAYHNFRGYESFNPYHHSHFPGFYGPPGNPSPSDNSGASDQTEAGEGGEGGDAQVESNSTTNGPVNRDPYGHHYDYVYKPQFGFPLHGYVTPYKSPTFGHFHGVFLDSFKKGFPYPAYDPFPFYPGSHFHPPFGGYYPDHNFRRPNPTTTTASDTLSTSKDSSTDPESISESALNSDAELISESQLEGVIDGFSISKAEEAKFFHSGSDSRDTSEILKRFVTLERDGYRNSQT